MCRFGGFGGLAFGGAAVAAEPEHDLDAELAQALKGLTKRDSNTKLRSLQSLDALVGTKDESQVSDLLPPWIYVYKRLALDNNRTVRARAASTFSKICGKVGRKLAPHLKSVMGVWWLAMSDPDAEASRTAHSAFEVRCPHKAPPSAFQQPTAIACTAASQAITTPTANEAGADRGWSGNLCSAGSIHGAVASSAHDTPVADAPVADAPGLAKHWLVPVCEPRGCGMCLLLSQASCFVHRCSGPDRSS